MECIIVNPKNLNKIENYFSKRFKPYIIGKIDNGNEKIKLNDKIKWF